MIAMLTARSEPGLRYAVGLWPSQGQQVLFDPTTYFMVGPTGMIVPGWYMTVMSTNLVTWRFVHTQPFNVPGYENLSPRVTFVIGAPVHDNKLPALYFRLLYSKERRTSPDGSGVVPAAKIGK